MAGKILDKSKIQGKLFWKKEWYSLCSRHQIYNKECDICQVGRWHNVWGTHLSGFFHDHFYGLWFWWVNKK